MALKTPQNTLIVSIKSYYKGRISSDSFNWLGYSMSWSGLYVSLPPPPLLVSLCRLSHMSDTTKVSLHTLANVSLLHSCPCEHMLHLLSLTLLFFLQIPKLPYSCYLYISVSCNCMTVVWMRYLTGYILYCVHCY